MSNVPKKYFYGVLFCVLLTLSSLPPLTSRAELLDDVTERGILRVGFSSFVPWAMQDTHGKFIGFEIDVATELARDFTLQAQFIPTKWSGIIPALLTGQFDIIIGGMSITPQRQEKVDFSDPYDYAGLDIAASRIKAAAFKSLEDFNHPEVILSARTGGSARVAIAAHFPAAQVRYFDEEAQAIQEVLRGKAHAFVSSAPLPALQAARHPDLLFRPLAQTFTKEPIGFAIRKGNPKMLKALNQWIKSHRESGWLEQRRRYWFEQNTWEKDLR